MSDSEIDNELNYLESTKEKTKLIDSLLEKHYFGESNKFHQILAKGFIGFEKYSNEDIQKLINEDYECISLLSLIGTHLELDGQWYLEFLINYGFKGYKNYSEDEIFNEIGIYSKNKNQYLYEHYLQVTNKIYSTSLKY